MAAIEVNVSALLAQPIDQSGYIRPSQKSIPSISGSSSDLELCPRQVKGAQLRSRNILRPGPTPEGVMTDKKRPDFEVTSVQHVGSITLLSGTPLP